jgi:hypothetical protein
MNPDISAFQSVSFLFQCVKVAATIFFPPKKINKASQFFLFFSQCYQIPKLVYGGKKIVAATLTH